MTNQSNHRDLRPARGSFTQFLVGACAAGAAAYMLTSRISVSSGWGRFWGYNSFGLALLPLLLGIGLLFFGGRAALAWTLIAVGSAIVAGGVLMNLAIYFRPTSLFDTLIMFGMLAAGIGLMARSLQART